MSARSSFPCPAIRPSNMPSLKSMADGQTYSDRNEYDASLKAKGFRIFETGEKPTAPEPKGPSARDIIEREISKYV